MKVSYETIVKAYKEGESINSIANAFGLYATTVRRILIKQNIELRHDVIRKGQLQVRDGEKLIEWAKAQGRLVTKAELAAVIGRKKLSPSYFIKYPELGQYVVTRGYDELTELNEKLYNWLKENNIPYKPDDRTKLGVSVSALLLDDYANIALQIAERPKCVSNENHNKKMTIKANRAKDVGITVVFLNKEHFENLDDIKLIIDDLKVGD